MSGLSWKDADMTIKKVFKYLDTIDLQPYIDKYKGKDLYDLMEKLEEKYEYNDEFSETLFDYIKASEFADYLNERYNLNIKETEVIKHYHYIR
jgi:hypothetical protein